MKQEQDAGLLGTKCGIEAGGSQDRQHLEREQPGPDAETVPEGIEKAGALASVRAHKSRPFLKGFSERDQDAAGALARLCAESRGRVQGEMSPIAARRPTLPQGVDRLSAFRTCFLARRKFFSRFDENLAKVFA